MIGRLITINLAALLFLHADVCSADGRAGAHPRG